MCVCRYREGALSSLSVFAFVFLLFFARVSFVKAWCIADERAAIQISDACMGFVCLKETHGFSDRFGELSLP